MKIIEANLQATGKKYALLVSRFNSFITNRLKEGCIGELKRLGAEEEQIAVITVPGAFEIPLAAQAAATSKKYDAVICLAAVIRGHTHHFEYVSSECAKGIAQVSLASGVPVIFGVITADTIEQAIERAGTKSGNKGEDAARTAVEMANLLPAVRS